jgi:hypothetical protein
MTLGIIIEQEGKLSVPSEIYHIPSANPGRLERFRREFGG